MNLDYLHYGATMSLQIAGAGALIFTIITAKRGAYNLRERDEQLVLFALGVSAYVSIFCAVYPVLNLILVGLGKSWGQIWAGLEGGMRFEFQEGIAALRITSLTVGFTALLSLVEVLRLDPLPATSNIRRALFVYDEALELKGSTVALFRNRFAHSALNLAQSGFYQLNILLLWAGKVIADKSRLPQLLLAYGLFYIIDDWRIVFRYSLALKGRMLKVHLRQLKMSNILITLAGAWTAWAISPVAFFIYLPCCYGLHRLLMYVRDGIQGGWQIPGALNWKVFDKNTDHETGERTGGAA